ncbi:hypothetical protein [Agromyces sp. NPDC049794]|uniref:hypothetical protein n=1 Tax=unclassified Agromyces TaxID=2639701 RepID=UPI0033CFEDE8
MTDVIDRHDVERILADPAFRVPEADADADLPADRFRARTSRFVNGAVHDARRRRLDEFLASLDVDALARAAATRACTLAPAGSDAVATQVPVACLAEQLGFAEPDSMPGHVALLAAHYPTGGPSDTADAALVRLLAAAPPPGRDEHRDDGVLRVQLLVQAYAATAALITTALRHPDAADAGVATAELLERILRETPPVRSTRRVGPDGNELVLHLGGPDHDSPPGEARMLAFGVGERGCPAPAHAVAIAAAIVDGLRAC